MNCYKILIYLFFIRDIVQCKENYSRKINESDYGQYGYGTMTFMDRKNGGRYHGTAYKGGTSTAMYYTSFELSGQDFKKTYHDFSDFNEALTTNQNAKEFKMTHYGFSDSNEQFTTSTQPNFIHNYNEVFNVFIYVKISVALTMLLIGLVANGLSFLIIVKQGLIQSGVWVYIASLAISDSLALTTSLISEFSKPPVNLLGNILNSNNIACKATISMNYLWSLISNYIVSCMAIERCLIILNPYKVPPGPRKAAVLVFIITVIIVGLQPTFNFNVYGIVKSEIANITDTNSTIYLQACSLLPEYESISDYIFMIDLLVYSVIPIILIVSANSCIIFTLVKRARNEGLKRVHRNAKKDMNITYMLIAISSLFILSNIPLIIFLFTFDYFYSSLEEAVSFESVGYTIVTFLAILNHCCNFFCYVWSGETFREKAAIFFRGIICHWDNQQLVTQPRRRTNVAAS